ncbi:hypothetical protein G9A89_006657 [Geosiphon pyriformis]|nr:hypothetical protein G9A89_006657 [Geosiphon pyriformis]
MVDPQEKSDWLKKEQKASRRTRILVSTIGIIVLVGVLAAIIYVLVHKGTSKSLANSYSANDYSAANNNATSTNGKLPENPLGPYYTSKGRPVNLTINADPRLHKSFYGMNYGPILALYPWCTNTLGDTIEDLKQLSQLTNRLRLYGMDCDAANYTLQAIELLKLDMTIIPTIWVDSNATTYQRQYDDFFNNLKQHGTKRIDGVSVGNEVLFRKEIEAADLYSRIADIRQKIQTSYPGSKIPVFTSDIGSNVDKDFVNAVEVAFANVHPYFGGISVNDAATWTFDFYEKFDVKPSKQAGKSAVISEIGWPTEGKADSNAVASVPNLQKFLDTFICKANEQGEKYYYFETYDTPWKTDYFTILEGSWGLFNSDRSFKKGITIPNCSPAKVGILAPNN